MSYIPDPITRKEHYMSYLTGSTTYYPKDPLTREEQYLFYLCENGGVGGGVTTEQIQAAVDAYLEENPPSGMTPEQIQELEGKLNSNQGTENAGKYMNVGSNGILVPEDVPHGITVKTMQKTDTAVTLPEETPYDLYIFPEMTTLAVTIANENTDVHFFFDSGTTATVFSLQAQDSGRIYTDAYSIDANMRYEVSVLHNVAYIKGVATGEA